MAVEKNPNERSVKTSSVVDLAEERAESSGEASFEYDESDGSVIVDFSGASVEEGDNPIVNYKEGFYKNLVEELDEDILGEISNTVIQAYEADLASRADWEETFNRGLDLLGLKLEETDEPFEGACTAAHPLILESAVTFQSKAIQELMPAAGPVKTQILGEITEEKELQAQRVKDYMNYQTTELMSEYFDETERMLFHLPLFGSGFKKIYYDAGLNRPVSEFVPIDEFVVSSKAKDLRTADRYTHVLYRSPVQLEREIKSGMYFASDKLLDNPSVPTVSVIRTKMNEVMGVQTTDSEFDAQYTLLEQHCYLDIETLEDETELTLPYIVTVDLDTGAVLSIRRNYDQNDANRDKKLFFTHYKFVPAFGFYGIGFIHMLGNLTASATAALRSLLDSGQFANLQGGFKAKGVRVVGENDPIAPGEFREVEATGMDLSKAIYPLPYKEPSQVLFAMLQFVTAAGQKFADSTEQIINDSANYGPVGTTMALLEASGKFFSAIHKRMHNSQKMELKILARINYESMPATYPFDMVGQGVEILREDFDGRVDIIPVSDPNVPSAAHRMMMAQMALQMSAQAPAGMYDQEELHLTILRAANIPNLDKIIPTKPKPQPLDPVSDIMAATKGMPIKAFIGQDHDSHIKVKMAYLQDPENGGNPMMQRIVPILAANIQEHSVMKYQEQMNGVTNELMKSEQDQSPEMIQKIMADAAQRVLQANQQMAQNGPSSPEEQMVLMERQRLQLDAQKQANEAAIQNAKLVIENRQLDLKERQLALDAYVEGAKNLVNIEQKDKDRQQKLISDALKMLTDLAKQDSKLNVEKGKAIINSLGKNIKGDMNYGNEG